MKIYCDLDGVLVNIQKATKSLPPLVKTISENKSSWWSSLPWTIDGKVLWDFLKDKNITILSTGGQKNNFGVSRIGKMLWCKNNLSEDIPVIVVRNNTAKLDYAKEDILLIDDNPTTIKEWEAAGGKAILHTDAISTIQKFTSI